MEGGDAVLLSLSDLNKNTVSKVNNEEWAITLNG